MKRTERLTVTYHNRTVGTLTMTPDGTRCAFPTTRSGCARGSASPHWSLAPAYDLTRCAAGYNGEHATMVNGKGRPTLEDMLTGGETIRIPRKRGLELIRSVAEACTEILAEEWKGVI